MFSTYYLLPGGVMRRARLTYPGAFHHAMNRGHNGEDIFTGNTTKAQFLDYLELYSKKMNIRILAYCIMNNHYHLFLENTSGKMSDFFRLLDGQYGMYYRKMFGESGYVFQGRYKSTLVQDDSYLKTAFRYLLYNPVRVGMVRRFDDYTWSSGNDYFKEGTAASIVDCDFINELFGSQREFIRFMTDEPVGDLDIRRTRCGEVLGDKAFIEKSFSRFERRKRWHGDGMKRIEDRYLDPVAKVLWEFNRKIGRNVRELDVSTHKGKRLRGELLRRLRDLAGLKYAEIVLIPPFTGLKLSSLPKLYKDALRRHRLEGEKKKS